MRHAYTEYDECLFEYDDRHLARERVREKIETVLDQWEGELISLRSGITFLTPSAAAG